MVLHTLWKMITLEALDNSFLALCFLFVTRPQTVDVIKILHLQVS